MRRMLGFSLIEVTVVLVVVGLLSMGVFEMLTVQSDYKRIKHTERTLNEIVESIYGFVIIYNRLPCADSDFDGIENCTSSFGKLPWKDLGVGRYDAWGQQLYYAVDKSLISAPLSPNFTSSLELYLEGDTEPIPLVPAIVWSAGKDFALNPRNGCETENADGDTVFQMCKYVSNQYDDILDFPRWNVVLSRLIRAKQLKP